MSQSKQPMTYRDAGVDIDAGNSLVERIKPFSKATHRPGVMGLPGGFAALFEVPLDRYKKPVLVSGTDGVGTKLKLAIELGLHKTIGIDLVAMCANDIAVLGAEPLFFLDYYATGHLDVDIAADVIEGIAKGCEYAGAALTGGETAEMPGMYSDDDYDLAGFCVGVVEKDNIIDGSQTRVGDTLIGIAASGPHSNGYSLIRRIVEHSGCDLNDTLGDSTLGEQLLRPTRIYVKALLKLASDVTIHCMAHITGGGLLENIPRVLPQDTVARIDRSSWTLPPVFQWLQEHGNVEETEMLRTFNCGVGMVIAVAAADADKAIDTLTAEGETAWIIGQIENGSGEPTVEIAS